MVRLFLLLIFVSASLGCDEDSAGSGAMDASGRTADMPSETDAQSLNAQTCRALHRCAHHDDQHILDASTHLDMASTMTDATPQSDLGSPLVDMGIEAVLKTAHCLRGRCGAPSSYR